MLDGSGKCDSEEDDGQAMGGLVGKPGRGLPFLDGRYGRCSGVIK